MQNSFDSCSRIISVRIKNANTTVVQSFYAAGGLSWSE